MTRIMRIPKKRAKKPYHRVIAALVRLSRDRYLPPAEVIRITYRLARCLTDGNGIVRAVNDWLYYEGCSVTGLLRGRSPVERGQLGYSDIVREARNWTRDTKFGAELKLLQALTPKTCRRTTHTSTAEAHRMTAAYRAVADGRRHLKEK